MRFRAWLCTTVLASTAMGAPLPFIDKAWLEKDPSAYAGAYAHTEVRGDEYIVHNLEISVVAGKFTARHSAAVSDEMEDHWMALKDVRISGNAFTCAGPVGKSQSVQVPRTWSGKFIRRYPPANAKGPVETGLLLGDWLFVKVE